MRVIAIETTGQLGSAGALLGESLGARLVRQTMLGGNQRTAQSLAPALRDLLADVGWNPQSIEVVAVAIGPGSFMGLRIGVTTAKTFAYAVGADVVGVNTLIALAAQAPPSTGALWTILDAQRQELFVAKFDANPRETDVLDCNPAIVSQHAWLAGLKPGDRVTGPPLRRLAPRLPEGVVVVPDHLWQPTAATVGFVAWQAYQAGRRDDLWKLAPNYYRPSYAEEKRAGSTEGGTSE